MLRFAVVALTVLPYAGYAFSDPTGAAVNMEHLAQETFTVPPLSEAEKRVVKQSGDGTTADCSDLGGPVEPADADGTPKAPDQKWPPSRNVRADLIRWLLVDGNARQHIDPRGIRVYGARVTGQLDLSFTDTFVPLLLVHCRFEQPVDFSFAKMRALSLEGSWTAGIKGDGLRIEGPLFLNHGFRAEGEVRLPTAKIDGVLDASGGTFKNSSGVALNADGITVMSALFLSSGFSSEGAVRLPGAKIGANLEATAGTFKNANGVALLADRIDVNGNVFLNGNFRADGAVRFLDAEVGGELEVADASIDEFILESAHVAGRFVWRDIDIHSWWNGSHALDLNDAKVGDLVDEEASWPRKNGLILDGFVYEGIAGGPTDAKTRLKWLDLQDGYHPQPYEHLIEVFRRMGSEDEVAGIAIAKQKESYEHGGLSRWGRFWNSFLYYTVRYGYESWLAFIWLLVLMSFGTILFWIAHWPSIGMIVPSDKDAYDSHSKKEKEPLPHYYPRFRALLYSLEVVLPFDLGQKTYWRLRERHDWDILYVVFESWTLFQLIAGWALLLVAAGVTTGLIRD